MKTDRVLAPRWIRATLCVVLALGGVARAESARLQVTPQSAAPWQSAVDSARPALRATPTAAPQLDGVLDDACWRDAPATGSFVRLAGVPSAAARWVSMQAAYDQQCLYLAGRLAKPGPTLRAAITQQGGRIWTDDALEIYLFDRQAGIRYQIDINALGAWWAGADQTWQPALQAAAKMDDQGWTVELALPWRDLQLATPGEHPLRLQFRYLVNGQSASVSWVDAEPEQLSAYGDLMLVTAGQDAPDQLQVLRFFQQDALPVGPSADAAGIELFNPTSTARSANVRLYRVDLVGNRPLRPGPDTAMDGQLTVEVAPGAHQLVRIPGVMPAIESGVIRQTLVVRAVNPATGKPAERLFQNTRDVGTLPPFELRLQRERFHLGDQRVEGTLNLGVPEELLAAAALSVQFGTRYQVLQQVNYDHVPSRRLTLGFDLAGLEPDDYQVVARLRHGDQVLEEMLPMVIERALPLPPRQRIALRVNLPAGFAATGPVPLYAGVSFPAGTLLDLAQVRVVNGLGEEVPAQVEALAHWGPGGSIRWAGVHFIAAPGAPPAGQFFVEFGRTVQRGAVPQQVIRIERNAQALRIDTGAARFDVPRTGPLLGDAWVGDRQALRGGAACLLIADQAGNVATELAGPAEETPQVELEGPLQVVIRRAGFLRRPDGSTLGKYIVRLTFAAGAPFVRVQHSFVNTEDTMQVQYRDLSLRVQPAFTGPWQVRLDDSPQPDGQAFAVQLDPTRAEAASLAQTVFHHHLQKENRFSVSVCRDGQWTEAKTGDACGQWASVSDDRGQVGVAVTLRHFVETFPSELSVGPEGLTAHLWSSRGGRLLDYRPATVLEYCGREWIEKGSRRPGAEWKGGADGMADLRISAAGSARTHDLCIHLFAGSAEADAVPRVAQLTNDPPLALQDPAWLRTTGALGPLSPHDPEQFPRAEKFIESFFRYHLVGQADYFGDYGFLDHGSGPHAYTFGSHDYREQGYPLLKRTFHFDYKFRSTPWRMYARSGDRMYFDYGDAKNRSLADFRWVHHPARGLRQGAMILSETSYNLPLYWAGTETMGFQGQDIDNFIYQYYLTGDRWVHETVQQFGQYLIDTFDPRTTKPVGDMYNYQPYMFLASLYEMTWDERLGDKLRAMRWTLDPDTTTGLMNWPTYGAWYKWYIEIFGPLRDYQVTGSRQARDAFLQLARLYITHAPAGRHLNGDMGYDDNYGLAMNLAWQLTGDERFAAHGREMLSRRLFWFSDESGESHRVGPFVAAHSAQGLDSYAYLMDLVAHMPADTPRYPALEVGADSPPVDVYLVKAPGAATRIAGVGGGDFDVNLIRLLDRKDARNRLGMYKLTMWPRYAVNDPQAGLHDRERYLDLVLPKEMAPGQYRLHDVREVSWTNAPQLIVAAPQGLAIPAASATPASWYFRVPAGKHGALYVDQPVLLERNGKSEPVAPDTWCELVGGPEDEVVKLTPARSGFDPLPFKPGRGYTVLTRIVKGTILVQFRGDIPPVLAPHDPGRLFLPDLMAPAAAPGKPARKADAETDD